MTDKKKTSFGDKLAKTLYIDLAIIFVLAVVGLICLYFGFRLPNPYDIVVNVIAGLIVIAASGLGAVVCFKIFVLGEFFETDKNNNLRSIFTEPEPPKEN
jgi:lipopolysaccharide export LptBFGC system permease protein LptF